MNLIKKVVNYFFYRVKYMVSVVDGNTVGGYLFTPVFKNDQGVVYCHGGFANIDQKHIERVDVKTLVAYGFSVLAIKFEDEWAEVPPSVQRDVAETLDSGRAMKGRGYKRVHLVGLSRGGYVALQTFAHESDFCKCVTFAAPTLLEKWPLLKQQPELSKYFNQARSALDYAREGLYDGKRMLLLHGGKDQVVPVAHVYEFAKFAKANFEVFSGYGHDLFTKRSARKAAAEFLNQN